MEKKHLSFGIFISLLFVTVCMYFLKKANLKRQEQRASWIGVLNGSNVYIPEATVALGKKPADFPNLKLFFEAYVDHRLISMEAHKLNQSKAQYLAFFDSMLKLDITPEELKYFSEMKVEEIKNNRKKRATSLLLEKLRQQNRAHFYPKNSAKTERPL